MTLRTGVAAGLVLAAVASPAAAQFSPELTAILTRDLARASDHPLALDYNLSLSNRRADAVVKALAAQYRIDPKRLTPRGLGPLAPVATNRSEDGQAQNRRVEMVEQ